MLSLPVISPLRFQRTLFTLGFLLCVALMATALYFQYVMGLEPCPLCIFQRVFVIGAGVVLLIGAIHNPGALGRRIYGVVVALTAGLGAALAGRQVWLQSLPPDRVPECGVGLDYMLEAFPLTKTIKLVLRGTGDCAEILWTFLGLSIPGWTLIIFCGFVLFGFLFVFARAEHDG